MTLKRFAWSVIALAIFCAASLILYRIAQSITMTDLAAALRDSPPPASSAA